MLRPPMLSVARTTLARGALCLVVAGLGLSACSTEEKRVGTPAAGDRVFVSQAGSSTLLAVDGASGNMLARIEVGMLPHNLVLSPDGRTLYAALVGSQAIAEIDTATLTLRRTLLTAPVPETRDDGSRIQEHFDENAFGATTCYECHRADGAQPKYAGDRPFGLLLSEDGASLYVTHLRESRLTVLDLEQGRIESTMSLAPAGTATEVVAIARLGDEVWVAIRPPQPSTDPGAIRRLDATTLEPIEDTEIGSDPGALLALPDRNGILVSHFESDTVTLHDAAEGPSNTPVSFEAAPGPLGLLALDASHVLALDYYSNAVSFLDLDDETAETLPLEHDGKPYANPTNAALASDGRSAWLVSSGTDGHLLSLDLASHAIARDISIDGLSFGVAVVPGVLP